MSGIRFPFSLSAENWVLGRLKALMQEQCLSEGRPIPAPPNPRKPFKASKDIGCRNENIQASTGMNWWRWVWAKRSRDFVIQRNMLWLWCTNSFPGLLCDTVAPFHFQFHVTVGNHGMLLMRLLHHTRRWHHPHQDMVCQNLKPSWTTLQPLGIVASNPRFYLISLRFFWVWFDLIALAYSLNNTLYGMLCWTEVESRNIRRPITGMHIHTCPQHCKLTG